MTFSAACHVEDPKPRRLRRQRVDHGFLACQLGFYAACASFCTGLSPLPIQAAEYVWDNGDGNGIWNDPVNWGLTNNFGYNVAPTASDTAAFIRGLSPAGTVTLTNDGFAQTLLQDFARDQRTITIDASQTVDRTLTLSGNGSGLIDMSQAGVQFTLDGTPNGNGARLKLQINGSGSSTGTPITIGVPLVISCDVSGAGGFILTGGVDGAGELILGGNDTYTGPTTVNAGTLLINGSTAAASTVSVASGTTLGGTGTINGPVTIAAGGLLSPGTSIGTLTINNKLTLGGDLLIKVNKSLTPSNDMVSVSGTLTNAGVGTLEVINFGAPLVTGDSFQIFNKPLLNGQAMRVLSAGTEVWTNKLAVDGSIAVLSATNPPITGDPTSVFAWNGKVTTDQPWKVPMQTAANWVGSQAPPPLSSNILVFQGDLVAPYNWPYVDTNYGTTLVIFSNNAILNSIKVLAGSNNTVNLGSYMRQASGLPCYFGITGPVPIKTWWATNAYFTNALGDASCGSQTEFQCINGELDVYGVLKDGAGTHSRLVKSGTYPLQLTGSIYGDDPNSYTGGTVVNAGQLKMSKNPGVNAIPGDVTVNGSGSLVMNVIGGEQIADTGVVTLNDYAAFNLLSQPETVGAIQSTSASVSIFAMDGVFTVNASSSGNYNGGTGEADYSGSISGNGTFRMNGTGIQGLLGANSVANLTVNSGTLKVNGNSGTGPVAVNSSGTLLGKGTIKGAVTVASGGTIGAGFGAGLLTLTAGLNMSASGNGATNVWELAALKDGKTGVAGTDYDRIVLTGGTLALGNQANLDIRFIGSATAPDASIAFWQSAHTWTNILLSGGSNPGSSNFGRVKNGSYAAGNFTTSVSSGSIVLTFTPRAAGNASAHYVDYARRRGQRDGELYEHIAGHQLCVVVWHESEHDELVHRRYQDGCGHERCPDRQFGHQSPTLLSGLLSVGPASEHKARERLSGEGLATAVVLSLVQAMTRRVA